MQSSLLTIRQKLHNCALGHSFALLLCSLLVQVDELEVARQALLQHVNKPAGRHS